MTDAQDPKDASAGVILLVEPSVRMLEAIDAICESAKQRGAPVTRADALLSLASAGVAIGHGMAWLMKKAFDKRQPDSRPPEPRQGE